MTSYQDFQNEVEELGSASAGDNLRLGEWTARDFSSFYVRYRPHLLNHASRLLRNKAQSEEVVQDAFLYLMTSLPDLVTELDVLRFLKWKTKMLAIDVLRKEGRMTFDSLEALDKVVEAPSLPSDGLEAAEDASIVRMALATLQPRHRQILIESVYLEKSIDDIARDMSLTPNAGRQLLFRARKAFKSALVGEADSVGLTISDLLSHRSSRLGTFVLTLGLMVSMGLIAPAISGMTEDPGTPVAVSKGALSEKVPYVKPAHKPSSPGKSEEGQGALQPIRENGDSAATVASTILAGKSDFGNPSEQSSEETTDSSSFVGYPNSYPEPLVEFTRGFLQTIGSSPVEVHQQGEVVVMTVGDYELSMLVSIDSAGIFSVPYFLVSGEIDGQEFLSISMTSTITANPSLQGNWTHQYVASDFVLTTISGSPSAIMETHFREIGVAVLLDLDSSGKVIRADSKLLLRSST